MFEKKYHSSHHDFKTGILCKLSFFFGFLFLFIFLFFMITSVLVSSESTGFLKQLFDISQSTVPGSLISLSLILIFAGIVLYLFGKQLAKLAKISDEIENSEEYIEKDID